MSNSNLQKGIILNGQDSLAVFKENGLVYRTADIESYTPIVFRNLQANTIHQFELKSVISKTYRIVDFITDRKDDDGIDTANDSYLPGTTNTYGRISIFRTGKRIYHDSLRLSAGGITGQTFLISPEDTIRFFPSSNINSLMFLCQPVYLENTIVVPEVMLDDSNNTGNENPSPEPVID